MANNVAQTNWQKVIDKFLTYEGTIIDFCKENNITTNQLYYRRKLLEKERQPTFHPIKLNKEVVNKSKTTNNPVNTSNDIRIEIGTVKIHIPSDNKMLLSTIIKELAHSC